MHKLCINLFSLPQLLDLLVEEEADHGAYGHDGDQHDHFFQAGLDDGADNIGGNEEFQSQQQVAAQVDADLFKRHRLPCSTKESSLCAEELDESEDNAPEHDEDAHRAYGQRDVFKNVTSVSIPGLNP